jgi:hypothetical protein
LYNRASLPSENVSLRARRFTHGALFNNQQSIGVGTEAGSSVSGRGAKALCSGTGEFQRMGAHTTLVRLVLSGANRVLLRGSSRVAWWRRVK